MPYTIIECDRCGVIATNLVTAGFFAWTDGQGICWMHRETAICEDCETVVAMEVLPQEDFDIARAPRRSFWRRLLGRPDEAYNRALDALAGHAVAEAIIALHRAPVCLCCGGDRVTPLPLPRFEDWNASQIYALGPRHPGCGGGLAARGSDGERVAPFRTVRVYDIHGQLIEEKAEWRSFILKGYRPPL